MKDLNTIIDQATNKSDLKSQDIPELDLYMDQIMTLFENNLSDNKRFEDDKLLTKTMINNYSKAGIIKPVKGKKYTKEQIIGMLLIYNLKNIISIQEIKQLLLPVYEKDLNLEVIYDQFLTIKNCQKQSLDNYLKNIVNENQLDIENVDKRLLTVMVIAALANQLISTVQGIIDSFEVEDS